MRGDTADGGSVFAEDDVRDVLLRAGAQVRGCDVAVAWTGRGVRKPEWGAVSVGSRYGRNGSIKCRQSTAYIAHQKLSHE